MTDAKAIKCGPTHHHACACREAAVAKLVEALEFYASDANNREQETGIGMMPSAVSIDGGYVARAALEEWRKV